MRVDKRYCNIIGQDIELTVFEFPTSDGVMPIISYRGKFMMCKAFKHCKTKKRDCIFTGQGNQDPFIEREEKK